MTLSTKVSCHFTSDSFTVLANKEMPKYIKPKVYPSIDNTNFGPSLVKLFKEPKIAKKKVVKDYYFGPSLIRLFNEKESVKQSGMERIEKSPNAKTFSMKKKGLNPKAISFNPFTIHYCINDSQ